MSAYAQFATDKDLELNGVWLEYYDENDSKVPAFRIKAGRAGGANRNYVKVIEKVSAPHRRALQLDMAGHAVANEILLQGYSRGVVLDWEARVDGKLVRGIQLPDGSLGEVKPDNVYLVLKEYPDLFADLQARVTGVAAFRAEQMETDAKN